MYEARANTGIDRMKIINAVAKSVPGPHKVDLNNPDKTIIVEIVKVRMFSLLLNAISYLITFTNGYSCCIASNPTFIS